MNSMLGHLSAGTEKYNWARAGKKRARASCASSGIEEYGILKDVDILDITSNSPHIKNEDRSQDIQEFFGPAYEAPSGADGKPRKFHDCKPCR